MLELALLSFDNFLVFDLGSFVADQKVGLFLFTRLVVVFFKSLLLRGLFNVLIDVCLWNRDWDNGGRLGGCLFFVLFLEEVV